MERRMIGRITETEIIWPEVDINGHAYNRPPAMTYQLAEGEFVVLPLGFADFARLEQPARSAPSARRSRATEELPTDGAE